MRITIAGFRNFVMEESMPDPLTTWIWCPAGLCARLGFFTKEES